MKQNLFIKKFFGFFIGFHLLFIVIQIYNYTRFISYLYTHQKNEKLLQTLRTKKQECAQELYALQDLSRIRNEMYNQHTMHKIALSQIKQITIHD